MTIDAAAVIVRSAPSGDGTAAIVGGFGRVTIDCVAAGVWVLIVTTTGVPWKLDTISGNAPGLLLR
jgi:hypothetical protein